jgi:predicted phosphodiesterase
VTAVRGNNESRRWANAIAECEVAKLGSIAIYMLHDVKELDPAVLPVSDCGSGASSAVRGSA